MSVHYAIPPIAMSDMCQKPDTADIYTRANINFADIYTRTKFTRSTLNNDKIAFQL